MARIAVVGNCSALGLANAIKLMSPDSVVKSISIASFDTNDPETVKSLLDDFDLTFPFSEIGSYALINQRVKTFNQSVQWPSIYFGGFHPDVVYFGVDGKPAVSCLGGYNSRIVAFAYAHGLSVSATADLFNPLVYGLLGYFDAYQIGRSIFLNTAEKNGLNLATAFERWEKAGIFMHTPNHPTVRVINDLARELMLVAGIDVEAEIDHERDTVDHLSSGVIWPVYPGIAQRLDVAGSLNFRSTLERGHRTLSLEEFIFGCFKEYEKDGFTREQFQNTGFYLEVKRKLSI